MPQNLVKSGLLDRKRSLRPPFQSPRMVAMYPQYLQGVTIGGRLLKRVQKYLC